MPTSFAPIASAVEPRVDGQKQGHRSIKRALYRRAKAQVLKRHLAGPVKARDPNFADEGPRLLHELQVHQVELEMQNAELQEARDKLEGLLEKYTDIYDFAPVGYLSLDEKGQILEVNLTGAALIGVGRSRLIQRRLQPFIAPTSRPVFLNFLEQVFAEGGKQVCEAVLRREDGTSFWADFHGTPAISDSGPRKWCRVVVSDITALKQAEEILRRNEALFSALIEQAPVGVYVVDAGMRVQQFNFKARHIFGKIHPVIGRDLSEIIHHLWPKRAADQIVALFRHTLSTGESYQSAEFAERRQDSGVEEVYEWQLQRISLPAGHHGVVCFINNITQRKRTEAAERRIEVLAASNQKLEREIVRRQAVEAALKKSEQHQSWLLERSRAMQEQLRHLSHLILRTQEEERKRISRELHDQIGQILAGITVRLAALKAEASANIPSLEEKITSTEQLVQHSVALVHRFARDLRPAVLDDLGLIPALHAFMKNFTMQTGVRTRLTAFAGVEQWDMARRTVLFRVAQEALANVARHAHASRVEVTIQKLGGAIRMSIKDNGQGFLKGSLHGEKGKRLGLVGMRERVEMVNGNLTVLSVPGKGTAVHAEFPFGNARVRGSQNSSRTSAKPNHTNGLKRPSHPNHLK